MKDKKHIDRLFQEKLKNFEANPNNAVWERISTQLGEESGQPKAMPIWWRIGGIAAGLLLLVGLGYAIFNDSSTTPLEIPTEIVDTNSTSEDALKDDDKQTGVTTDTSAEVSIEESKDDALKNNLVPQNQIVTSQESPAEKNSLLNDLNEQSKTSKEKKTNTSSVSGIAVTNKANTNKVPQPKNDANDPKLDPSSINKGVTQQEPLSNEASDPKDPKGTEVTNAVAATNDMPQDISRQPTANTKNKDEATPVTTEPSTTEGVAVTDISSDNTEIEKVDTNNITEEASPSIEDAVATSEDGEDYDEKEKEVIDRWSVTPNVSPVYYNTLGNGSSLNEQFNSNSKSGQLNMSYGVKAGYAITDKLSIRSGVSKIDVGYNTNDVIIYQGLGSSNVSPPLAPNSRALENIDLKEEMQGITVFSGNNLAFAQVPSVVAENLQSSLDQELSFIEVPLEVEYKISDKKLDVSVIGGVSTLILTENSVYADFDNERRLLGEANNVKNTSFSANFGVGLGVKVSEKIDLNFEPNFKYQINAFSNTSGDFKPYILGVNTGLKFKF